MQVADADIRHFIYTTFAQTSHPPTRLETSERFGILPVEVEQAYARLANAHHIALAPGTHEVWMAHPFSALPSDHVTEIGGKRYWGN